MKKVLFITYYWPPSGKASLHWPLKIIKHLPSFGWTPSVLTVDEDTFTQKDETFLKEIPADVKVYKAKSYEPFNIYKKIIGKRKDEQLIASETISKKNNSFAHRFICLAPNESLHSRCESWLVFSGCEIRVATFNYRKV